MSRLVWLVAVCGLALAPALVRADEVKPAPAKKEDPTERLLTVLAETEPDLGNRNPNETPVFEMLAFFAQKHGVTFVINTEAFRQIGIANIKEEKPKFDATPLSGQTMHRYLNVALEGLGATYLVKNGVIEIVPVQHAAALTKSALDTSEINDGGGRPRLKEPLVSAVIKEKPLNEAVAKLAEMYDLTVIVSPQAGDAKTERITARLLNVPADKAIELLAVQCDLRVVRKGNVFLITSKGQVNELFGEKLERERQKIELEKFREAPAAPPKPPQPEPKM